MRISPINMAYKSLNCKPQKQNNNQKQNISFGTYESAETKQSFWTDVLLEDEEDLDTFEYFEKPFVTVKRHDNFFYAVLNREVTDKHPNKEMFDKVADNYISWRRLEYNKPAKDAGIIDKEPDFLTIMEDYKDASSLCDDLEKAEEGPKPERKSHGPEIDVRFFDPKEDFPFQLD